MWGFFSGSSNGIKLNILQERISRVKRLVSSKQINYLDALQEKNIYEGQYNSAKAITEYLISQHNNKIAECDKKQLDMFKTQQEHDKLVEEKFNISKQVETAERKLKQAKSNKSSLKYAIHEVENKIKEIGQEIIKLDALISSPGPQPRWGKQQVNNMRMFVRGPERSGYVGDNAKTQNVLLNTNEINQHKEEISYARANKANLEVERREVQQKLAQLRRDYFKADSEVSSCETDLIQEENQLNFKEKEIKNNEKLYLQQKEEYARLLAEERELGDRVSNAQIEEINLLTKLTAAKYNVSFAQDELTRVEQELEQLTRQCQELQEELNLQKSSYLEQLALQEIMQEMQEKAAQESSDGGMKDSTADILEKLGKLSFSDIIANSYASSVPGQQEGNTAHNSDNRETTKKSDATPQISWQEAKETFADIEQGAIDILKKVGDTIKEVGHKTREVVTTATDVWPYPGIFQLKSEIKKMEGIVGMEPQPSDNLIIDNLQPPSPVPRQNRQ